MEFSTIALRPDRVETACAVVGIFEDRKLSRSAAILDRAAHGMISEVLRHGDIDGKCGKTRLLYRLPGVKAERVLLLGLGKKDQLSSKSWREAVHSAITALLDTGAKNASLFLAELPIKNRDLEWKARHFCMAAESALYRFDRTKSRQPVSRSLSRLTLGLLSGSKAAADRGIKQGRAIAAGINLAKDLGNLPGNICTPSYLAKQAVDLGKDWRLDVKILEQKDIEKLAMGALLSVAKGSRQPPKFIVVRYDGAHSKEKPIVLVGKGITFDTGGISLKPGAAMDEMKFDMCGAASVLGTMRAIAELKLRLNVVALIPATENMPDGAASRPGDVITSMSGQTIEILNTDAEGRLILCDALSYAERLKPQAVVDVATLTGACIVALGHVCSGVFSNQDALAQELIAAGEDASDRAWQLPLWEDYQEDLKSNFADMANVGGKAAGSITAAAFLSRFASKFDWAHLDIAGTAWLSGKAKGATGRPVPLLTSFLMRRSGKG